MKQKSSARLLLFVLPVISVLLLAGDLRAESVSEMSFKKTVWYRGEIPIIIDYEKGILEVEGKEIPILVDGGTWEDVKVSLKRVVSYVDLTYDRFNVHIPSDFYAGKEEALQTYFDYLHPRFIELESQTGWISEDLFGSKLDITVYDAGSTCATGWGAGGTVVLGLNSGFGDPDICKRPYYIDGVPYYDNPGDFGDQWIYAWGGVHELLHGINPYPILSNRWLREGWSQYYGFNIPAQFGDINQETADYYIENAKFSSRLGSLGTGAFAEYVIDDYYDGHGHEIQKSTGYDISAWMFSMLRDDYSLNWAEFYDILNSNLETLNEGYVLGDYFTDTYVIDLFGRASGLDFETETKPIWRYDGPSGPGWGVRQWTDLDWYADLTPELSLSDDSLFVGDTLSVQASIWNNGGVSLDSVSVRFYEGSNLIDEQFVDFPCSTMTPVSVEFATAAGDYALSVRVDEDSIKIEKSGANNDASADVTFLAWYCGDADGSGGVDIDDVVYLISYIFSSGPEPVPYESGDADCSGAIDIDDVVYLIGYIFSGGNSPCDPNGDEVPDC